MVIIIGAGLSGLLTAYRLKKAGIPFNVLEARDRIGGRMHTINSNDGTPIEMGATWFNPQHELLIKLLEELKISYFEQYMKGATFYQRVRNAPAEIIQLPPDGPSYRIAGGTSHLTQKLYDQLDCSDVLLNQSVTQITNRQTGITIEANESHEAQTVILAIPPKLWANNITFHPELPTDLVVTAEQTHTWMEDSIKVGLVYLRPFWRKKGQAGTLFSHEGPITEFYDQCNVEGTHFSLCGFVNPAYGQLSRDQRKQMIIHQLKMTMGEEAAQFIAYHECIWRDEAQTHFASDHPIYPHKHNGHPVFATDPYDNRLILSSTEVSPHFGGYMEGAVYSAEAAVKKALSANF